MFLLQWECGRVGGVVNFVLGALLESQKINSFSYRLLLSKFPFSLVLCWSMHLDDPFLSIHVLFYASLFLRCSELGFSLPWTSVLSHLQVHYSHTYMCVGMQSGHLLESHPFATETSVCCPLFLPSLRKKQPFQTWVGKWVFFIFYEHHITFKIQIHKEKPFTQTSLSSIL